MPRSARQQAGGGSVRRAGSGTAGRAGGRGRAQPYHHGAVRERLLQEALALIAEGGTSALSLREAARRVGVTHAAAYHHFPDKSALVATLATDAMWRLARVLRVAERRVSASDLERVCRIGAAYVRFALRNPPSFRVAFAPEIAHKGEFPALRAASDAASAPLLRSLQRLRGTSGTLDDATRELGVAIWSLVHGLSVLALDAQFDEGELRVPAARARKLEATAWSSIKRHLGGG
jgi:AcrR family transcriptional regulator